LLLDFLNVADDADRLCIGVIPRIVGVSDLSSIRHNTLHAYKHRTSVSKKR